jgi:hypothetical protein
MTPASQLMVVLFVLGATGRIERAHLTLQDRVAKELSLKGISIVGAPNEFMPSFIENYHHRFGKLPRVRHDAHRSVREDEDLDLTFSWQEACKVNSSLSLQYMLADNFGESTTLRQYSDVLQFSEGRVKSGAITDLLHLQASVVNTMTDGNL